jgi:branched-subunit amino acid transport protein
MTTALALIVVGAGSLAYRMLPLLGAARVPGAVARVAGWAGMSVLAAITVRAVLHHEDGSLPAATAVPVAVVSVGLGLLVAARGRHTLVALAAGAGCYLVLGALLYVVP